ncbi:MAG: carboxymuconolactone decarboxylase family protein [Candidatus Binatia bacterium]
MARLPYVDFDNPPDPIRDTLERIPVDLNIFKMIANAETCFRPFLRLGSAILAQQDFDDKLRELVILQVGRQWNGRYEWEQHVPIAEALGVDADQIAAIDTGDLGASCFDEVEKAVLAFTREVVEEGKPSDATFAAAAERLSAREIVEMLLTIGFYSMVAMVTESTGIEIDEPVGMAVIDSAK